MKKYNDQTLGEAIKEMIEAYRLDGKLNEVKLIGAWEKVAGKMISRHTKDLNIKDKKLYVTLDSPALRNELSYAREKIIKALNDAVGLQVIDEIVFV